MSKEELRLSNQAKKLLNDAEPKLVNHRVERPTKKRSTGVVKRSIDEVHQVPSAECIPILAPKIVHTPLVTVDNNSDDERLIQICVNLHKSTFNFKPSQEIDVRNMFDTIRLIRPIFELEDVRQSTVCVHICQHN
jgi:hypothetical protein